MTVTEQLSLDQDPLAEGPGVGTCDPTPDLPLDAPVRLDDPDTSVAAAASVEQSATNDRALVLGALHSMGGRGTADQITDWLQATEPHGRTWQRSCVSSRCSQLKRRGLIRDTGDRGEGSTGRPTIVFEATV